jgi:hypothetical protein
MLGKACAKRSAFVATFAWEAQKAPTLRTELLSHGRCHKMPCLPSFSRHQFGVCTVPVLPRLDLSSSTLQLLQLQRLIERPELSGHQSVYQIELCVQSVVQVLEIDRTGRVRTRDISRRQLLRSTGAPPLNILLAVIQLLCGSESPELPVRICICTLAHVLPAVPASCRSLFVIRSEAKGCTTDRPVVVGHQFVTRYPGECFTGTCMVMLLGCGFAVGASIVGVRGTSAFSSETVGWRCIHASASFPPMSLITACTNLEQAVC